MSKRSAGIRAWVWLLSILLAAAAALIGSTPAQAVASTHAPVGIVATPSAKGYWLVAADGGVFAFGDARFHGSRGGQPLNAPIVGMAATPSAKGYWLVAQDGGIFAYGDARFFGSMGGQPLNASIVGMAATPSGGGYWLVAADGGIFAYGDARFAGSMGGQPLNAHIVSMATTPTGHGYWLVAADGGIFAYGDARFFGSRGGQPLNAPIVGMTATPSARGYWLMAADGGVFAYGDARFLGGLTGVRLAAPIVAATSHSASGYWLLGRDGGVFAFGSARYYGRIVYAGGDGPAGPVRAGYALVVPRKTVTVPALNKPHHDHAAADIPVGVGTPFYAVTSGIVTTFKQDGGCGWGVKLEGDDRATYVYCHASSRTVDTGRRVSAGTQLGLSGGKKGAKGAGNSGGPHLHFQITYAGKVRCPQAMLVALYEGRTVPPLNDLKTTGCFYQTKKK